MAATRIAKNFRLLKIRPLVDFKVRYFSKVSIMKIKFSCGRQKKKLLKFLINLSIVRCDCGRSQNTSKISCVLNVSLKTGNLLS